MNASGASAAGDPLDLAGHSFRSLELAIAAVHQPQAQNLVAWARRDAVRETRTVRKIEDKHVHGQLLEPIVDRSGVAEIDRQRKLSGSLSFRKGFEALSSERQIFRMAKQHRFFDLNERRPGLRQRPNLKGEGLRKLL